MMYWIDTVWKIMYIIVFIVSMFTAVITWINGKKTKHLADQKKAKENAEDKSLIDIIAETIPTAIQNAEEWFGSGKGTAKKEYVMDKVQNVCYRMNVDFDTELIDRAIEKMVEMSKSVNVSKGGENNVYPRQRG